jgi:hypothetical protein
MACFCPLRRYMRFHITLSTLAFAFVSHGLPAQTTTFALFTPANPGQKLLVFDNDQTSHHSIAATLDTANTSSGSDVNFAFNPDIVFTGALAALNGSQKADFIMQSKTDDKAVGVSNSILLQPIDSGTMEFRLETPVDGKDLLLKVTFSDVWLFTSGSSGLDLAMEKPPVESKITYASDFLNFNPLSPNSWAIALSDIDPCPCIGCDGALNDFSASGLGVFLGAATPMTSIPEPGTYAIITALASLAAALLRRPRARLFPVDAL